MVVFLMTDAYKCDASSTNTVPARNEFVMVKSYRYTLAIHDKTMLMLVAKPLRMLSACFTTRATISPPNAWHRIAAYVHPVKSWEKPCSMMAGPSEMYAEGFKQ